MSKYVIHTVQGWNVTIQDHRSLQEVSIEISDLKKNVGWYAHIIFNLTTGQQMAFFVDQLVGVREA